MHTVASPSVVSTGAGITPPCFRTRIVRCPGCHSQHSIPAEKIDVWPLCHSCRKSAAQAEARKLLNDVLDLRRGVGVFSDLTLDERLEQLEALGIGQQVEADDFASESPTRQEIEDRLEAQAEDAEESRLELLRERQHDLHAIAQDAERWDGCC
jgi:hypothetical protein